MKTVEQELRDYEIQKRMAAKEKRIARQKLKIASRGEAANRSRISGLGLGSGVLTSSARNGTASNKVQRKSGMNQQTIKKVSKRRREAEKWRADRRQELRKEAGEWMPCPFSGHMMRSAEAVLCEKRCRGMRGDGNTKANTFLGCAAGNSAQGSQHFDDYMKLPEQLRRRNCCGN